MRDILVCQRRRSLFEGVRVMEKGKQSTIGLTISVLFLVFVAGTADAGRIIYVTAPEGWAAPTDFEGQSHPHVAGYELAGGQWRKAGGPAALDSQASVSAAATSIQDAIDAAEAAGGGAVLVPEGEFHERITLARNVHVYGAGPDRTTLNGDAGGTVVTAFHISYATIYGFTITNGYANNGGGMHNEGGSLSVTNCTFSGNTASEDGGGMYNYSYSSSPVVTNCTFSGNSAKWGGGMYNEGMYDYQSLPVVTNCTFSGNTASDNGGGMCNYYYCSPAVTNCTFTDNDANAEGGGMSNYYKASPKLANCTFSGNTADWGGGMNNRDDSSPLVTNCTFSVNTAHYGGGGISNFADSSLTVVNSILWGDSPFEIHNDVSSLTFTYSDVQGGYAGTGNIDQNPLFVNAAAGNFHLLTDSPCINAGDNSASMLPGTDFEDDPRIIDGIVDMGADEARIYTLFTSVVPVGAGSIALSPPGPRYAEDTVVTITADAAEGYAFDYWSGDLSGSNNPNNITMDSPKSVTANFEFVGDIIYVNNNATGNNNGSCWEDAFTGLQDAFNLSTAGCQIWVAEGIYMPGALRTDSFQMKNGVAVYGGFPNTGDPNLEDRDPQGYASILSGDIGAPEVNSDNSYHVVYSNGVDANGILDGFTITDGSGSSGGGMYNVESSPTINNCTFSNNTTKEGIAAHPSSPGNPGACGGGMYNDNSSPALTNCTFSGNSTGAGGAGGEAGGPALPGGPGGAGGDGAGIYNTNNSAPTFVNCIFTGNVTGAGGDGADGGDVDGPVAPGGAGGAGGAGGKGASVHNEDSTATLIDCTFNSNSTGAGGAGGDGGDGGDGALPTLPAGAGGDGGAGGGGGFGAAIHNENSSTEMTNCTFYVNSTGGGGPGGTGGAAGTGGPGIAEAGDGGDGGDGGSGAAVNNSNSPQNAINCTFRGNLTSPGGMGGEGGYSQLSVGGAGGDGGDGGNGSALNNFNSSPTVTNCTFSENSTGSGAIGGVGGGIVPGPDGADGGLGAGGGMYNEISSPAVTNCILWGDEPDEIFNSGSSAVVTYCDVQGGWADPNNTNIDADPCFVDPGNGDFHILADSACIDAGNNNSVPAEVTTDPDGYPRIVDGDCNGAATVDMGAYEYNWYGIGDFDNNCIVNFLDFSILAGYWRTDEYFVDIAPPGGDGIIDFDDVAVLCDHWLD
jgi:parallel beta-helix repeat protein